MAKIEQHRPAYFTGFENAVVEFKTLQELLDIDFIKNFSTLPNFNRYSITNKILMAEYDDGYKWFVIGCLIDLDFTLNLPIWEAKYKKEE